MGLWALLAAFGSGLVMGLLLFAAIYRTVTWAMAPRTDNAEDPADVR
jgi:hypothetical protein